MVDRILKFIRGNALHELVKKVERTKPGEDVEALAAIQAHQARAAYWVAVTTGALAFVTFVLIVVRAS
jgi:hypothetical protein